MTNCWAHNSALVSLSYEDKTYIAESGYEAEEPPTGPVALQEGKDTHGSQVCNKGREQEGGQSY